GNISNPSTGRCRCWWCYSPMAVSTSCCCSPAGNGSPIARSPPARPQRRPPVAEPLLRVEGLTRRFGGVVASDDIRLDVAPGELHAVIGPNGAGKTTLIGQLAGEIAPDAGCIHFDGRDVTALEVHQRSLMGLARSFQITSLFPHFTALENVALAVQAHAGHSFR